jgi:hypothetical protein
VNLRLRILALAALVFLASPGPAMANSPGTVHLTGVLCIIESDTVTREQLPPSYSLSTDDGLVGLEVSGDASRKIGSTVELTGSPLADGRVAVDAAAIVVVAPAAVPGSSASGSDEVTPATATTMKIAVIIGYYTDLASPVTWDQAADAFVRNAASVKKYFETVSRGRVTTETWVYGPWALGISQCTGGSSGVFDSAVSAAKSAAKANDVSLYSFDHIVVWTKAPCGVGWIGQAQLPGRWSQSVVDYSKYPSDEPGQATWVASHEIEHNMMLDDSHGLACYDASGHQVVLTGSNDCYYGDHMDQYSTMGKTGESDHPLLDAERLRSLGWLDPSESLTVTSTGTYTIVPVYSGLTGLRELRIAATNPVSPGYPGFWTIELRSNLAGTRFDQFSAGSLPATTGISIRYSENQVSGFGSSYLVDTVPSGTKSGSGCSGCSWWDAPLQPGQTLADTLGGFTITLDSVGPSGASVTIGDTRPPTQPATLTATALAAGGARLDWTASTDNLGLAGYRIYRDGEQIGETDSSTLTYTDPPILGVTGLHTYWVKAVDTAGQLSSAATATANLLGKPGAPTGVTATPGNSAVLVRWTAPSDNGATITGYTVLSTPDGAYSCTTTGATSCIVDGLTNGVPYRFTVTASNSVGVGPASAATDPVTPLDVPSRPTGVAGTVGVGTIQASWTAPGDLGGGTFSGYVATASPGGLSCSTMSTTCQIEGLTNGTAYTITVVASSSVGPGLPSDPSAPLMPRTVPDQPTGVTAVAANSTATVSWAAPAFNGGATVTSYTATSVPDGRTCTTSGLSCQIVGLTNRTSYQFTVRATNVAGEGPASDKSTAVVPALGATYVPVTPNRLVDSRPGAYQTGLTSALTSKVPARFQVTNRSTDPTKNIPSTAVAVTGNLTAVSTKAYGYFSLTPEAPVGIPETSSLNFPAKDIRANAVTVPLGAGGTLWITFVGYGGTVNVVFDVSGYFIPNTSASTYVPVTPNRLVDSRPGPGQQGLTAVLTSLAPAMFQVTDRSTDPAKNIPSNAVAVTGNLTAVSTGGYGYFSLTPARPVGAPSTSTINFPAGDVRANAITVPLGPGGTLWITFAGYGGTMNVVFDVTGYFVPNTSGATYVPVKPNRLVDSRPGAQQQGLTGALTSRVPAMFGVTDRSTDPAKNIPGDAVAVTGNLTAVSTGAYGYFSLTPVSPVGTPDTSTLNFPASDIRANAVTASLGPGGTAWVTFVGDGGTMNVVFDVSGYYTMN